MDFETELKSQVAKMPPSFNKRRLAHILLLPANNWRRQHALLHMEQAARDDLNIDGATEIAWAEGTAAGTGAINWVNIMAILVRLLPLLLALFGI